jgi:hypothetical protein
MIFALLIGGLYLQNQKIARSCEDRNANADRFRSLLLIILEPAPGQPAPTDAHSKRVIQALHDYTNSLERVNC